MLGVVMMGRRLMWVWDVIRYIGPRPTQGQDPGLIYEPPSGAVDGWIPIHVGSRPYANLYCPFRASITLKGFNNLAQGRAPGNQSDRPYVYPVRII